MVGVPRPVPSYLDGFDKLKVQGGQQIWANKERTRYFTWDYLHGEIEGFNKRGKHLGAFDARSGELIKPAIQGRTLDV